MKLEYGFTSHRFSEDKCHKTRDLYSLRDFLIWCAERKHSVIVHSSDEFDALTGKGFRLEIYDDYRE